MFVLMADMAGVLNFILTSRGQDAALQKKKEKRKRMNDFIVIILIQLYWIIENSLKIHSQINHHYDLQVGYVYMYVCMWPVLAK